MFGTDALRRGCLAVAASLFLAATVWAQPPVNYNGPLPPQAMQPYGGAPTYYPQAYGYPPYGYPQYPQYPQQGYGYGPGGAYTAPEPPPVEVDTPTVIGPRAKPVGKTPAARLEADALLWWISGAPIGAPVLTQGPFASATPGTTVLPGNRVVYGNETRSFAPVAGFRLTMEAWEPTERDVGMSVSGFILGRVSNRATFGSNGQDLANSLNFAINPVTPLIPGSTQNLLAGGPVVAGVTAAGNFTAEARTSLWGAEVNSLFGAWRNESITLDMLAGFKYLDLNEELLFTSYREDSDQQFQRFGSESFGTRNQFYGGQIGSRAEYVSGPFVASVLTTIAMGSNIQTIAIDGQSIRSGVQAGTAGGVSGFNFTQPSNIGKFSQNRLSVVPTIQLRTGYRLTERIFASVGYDFTYWTDVVRPGNQIDNVANLSQSSAAPNGQGVLVGPARPTVPYATSDFWAQGLLMGLEVRY